MNKLCVLLGLPGLYQNWMQAALDSTSKVQFSVDSNFISYSKTVQLRQKLEINIQDFKNQDTPVINTYVAPENFAWYLYNFLEKTDAIGISVNSLHKDLFIKAPGTVAFDSMLTHFANSYNLDTKTDPAYFYNAAIEYFYFLLIDRDAIFKSKSSVTDPDFINIEYAEFSDPQLLVNKLKHLPNFDRVWFYKMYSHLYSRNKKYLSRHQNFLSKLRNYNKNFDIIETAYIGFLVNQFQSGPLDWFNNDVRTSIITNQWAEICNQSKKYAIINT